jgi:hypothetical protein
MSMVVGVMVVSLSVAVVGAMVLFVVMVLSAAGVLVMMADSVCMAVEVRGACVVMRRS